MNHIIHCKILKLILFLLFLSANQMAIKNIVFFIRTTLRIEIITENSFND